MVEQLFMVKRVDVALQTEARVRREYYRICWMEEGLRLPFRVVPLKGEWRCTTIHVVGVQLQMVVMAQQ
jgi:hypothetical protein